MHLPDVAKAYGLRDDELINLFHTQPSLGVDPRGALVFACEGLAVNQRSAKAQAADGAVAESLTAGSSILTLASGTAVDAFKLHSLPGVTRVIYLDFTGHTTTGTSWNSSGNSIASGAFNLDADPLNFNTAERSTIQKIWQRVAEDYAPFNVDVTTEDPGLEGLRLTDSSDVAYGIRVVISPTNWYNANAGGVAYVGSFTWNSDTPCFVFTEQLGTNSDKYIGEAVSHEVGHTFGLYHDGRSGASATEYYEGQGDWAPIMGVGYYKAVTQFSKGEYANANNLQDDVQVVTGKVGVSDDHGNSLATATVLTGATISDGGTIETRSDVDYFRFDSGAGTISLTIASPSPSPNLDIKAELLNSTGQVLQSSDVTPALSASIQLTVPAGTYFLKIDGVGNGDPVTTGYSDYGSLGNYLISGSVAPLGTKVAPNAVITASTVSGTAPLAVSFSAGNSTDSDGTITSYQWTLAPNVTATGLYPSYTYTVAGSYPVSLTVVDNDGLAGTANVTINVAPSANVPPVAVASGSPTTGFAPLPVTFSSAGSSDSDGTITSYAWDFGDGTNGVGASPTKTYSVPGTYTAKLTVTDDRGGTATSSVLISAAADQTTDCDVQNLALATTKANSGTTVSATTTMLDRSGRPVSGVTIVISWSGLISGSATGKTDSTGHVTIVAGRTKKSGTVTATITNVTPPAGTVFDGSIYSASMVVSKSL
ncbi:MAG: PKD domain-containing protein [Opitutus sp.]